METTALAPALGNSASSGESSRRPRVLIQPARGLLDLNLRAVWQYSELLYFLAWRDVKIRYKQTVIGAAWAVVQPLTTMAIFTIIFSRLAGISSDGIPYPLFAFSALLPATYFSQAMSRSGMSLVSDANLITKVYFPRLIVPISAVLSPLMDFAVAFAILLVMMIWFHVVPTWGVVALPIFMLLALTSALAVSLWLSALCVKYRDVSMIIPFLVQIWMYLSPVAYPSSLVPEKWRTLYSLNPMAGVIEGFRWALLGTAAPDIKMMAISAGVVLVLLVTGVVYFRQMERTFADVV